MNNHIYLFFNICIRSFFSFACDLVLLCEKQNTIFFYLESLNSLPPALLLSFPLPTQPPGPRRSQQGQRKEPRKIIASVSLNDDVQLNKAEKAWKPGVKKATRRGPAAEEDDDDPEVAKTQELFRRVRSVLNKLTPQMFQQLMKQVTELTIDTEERLKGVIDLIFEKAISEPNFSVAYANMCRCLMGVSVWVLKSKVKLTDISSRHFYPDLQSFYSLGCSILM